MKPDAQQAIETPKTILEMDEILEGSNVDELLSIPPLTAEEKAEWERREKACRLLAGQATEEQLQKALAKAEQLRLSHLRK